MRPLSLGVGEMVRWQDGIGAVFMRFTSGSVGRIGGVVVK
jgi:hypothetical protein